MRKIFLTLLITLTLLLSACSGQSPATIAATQPAPLSGSLPGSQASSQPKAQAASSRPVAADNQTNPAAPAATTAAPAANPIPVAKSAPPLALQLLVGTLKLEGDTLAITKEQAANLLPLWASLKTASMSMAPAPGSQSQPTTGAGQLQAQTDDLTQQISAALTAEQLQAITDMNITQETAMTTMQGLGFGGPGGGQPGGAQGTPPAGGLMIPPPMFDALLNMLAEIAGVTSPMSNANSSGMPGNPPSAGGQQAGNPPSGEPFAGGPQAGGQPGSGQQPGDPPPAGGNSAYTITAVYTQEGDSKTLADQTFTASQTDQSAIYVTKTGELTLTGATITTSGDTSSSDNSSFHGLNAAVLAEDGSTIQLTDSSVSTTGSGANGVFATGKGASATIYNVTINATGDGGHAVMATEGGALTLTDVDMTTAGANSGAIATDRGSGTIIVSGGSAATSGPDSPAIYSTGKIIVSGALLSATGAEAAVIEGGNSIDLADTSLSSSKEKWGVMIYQSMSGDAEGTRGVFSMTGGALTYTPSKGPLFYVTNSTGVITLKGVSVINASDVLVQAARGRWGINGANGGNVILAADGQALSGNLLADDGSTLEISLVNNSLLTGAIDPGNTAQTASLSLDASSTWSVTADSYLTGLAGAVISGGAVANVTGNGFSVYYDPAACPELGGQTYNLNGGGTLKPAN